MRERGPHIDDSTPLGLAGFFISLQKEEGEGGNNERMKSITPFDKLRASHYTTLYVKFLGLRKFRVTDYVSG